MGRTSSQHGRDGSDLDEGTGHAKPSHSCAGDKRWFIGGQVGGYRPIRCREVDAIYEQDRPLHDVMNCRPD